MAMAMTDCDLALVHEGAMSFDEYARRTLGDWAAMAAWLRRRWSVPEAVEAADVLQELLTAAWDAIGKWDPARGVAIGTFVRWRAIAAASYWLHRQRGTARARGAGPSRYPISVGLVDDDVRLAVSADQLGLMLWAERFSAELSRLDEAERLVVWSVGESFDPTRVASEFYGDAEFRRRQRWGNEIEARRFVRRSLQKMSMPGEEQ